MKTLVYSLMLAVTVIGCNRQHGRAVTGPFNKQEVEQFVALDPIDAHAHVFLSEPAFKSMFRRLNLHLLDILVIDDTNNARNSLSKETQQAWEVIHGSDGRITLCTTFDPYNFKQPDFAEAAVRQINQEFNQGAIAVKIWKNIGMELEDGNGNYILPDNPIFEPIYQDIAAHNKTLLAHLAEPRSLWEPPNPDSPDYNYYTENPQWYMYNKPHRASKEQILQARDHLIEENPNLRVVGAHLGSLEDNLHELGRQFDLHSNFAVDLAGRMPYLMLQPRADMITFVTKYEDRLIYGTDLELGFGEKDAPIETDWEDTYAKHWRYLATNDTLYFRGHLIRGLALPQPIVRKLYHDNALRWFPGISRN